MNLSDFRISKGWSQAELGKHIGCSQTQVQRIEAGLRMGSAHIIQRIEKVTERAVTLADLIACYEQRQGAAQQNPDAGGAGAAVAVS